MDEPATSAPLPRATATTRAGTNGDLASLFAAGVLRLLGAFPHHPAASRDDVPLCGVPRFPSFSSNRVDVIPRRERSSSRGARRTPAARKEDTR